MAKQALAGSLGALGRFPDAALHLAEDHFAHGLLQPGLVAEVAVEHGLRGAGGRGDVLHRSIAAERVHRPAGGLDQLPAALLAVATASGRAAVDVPRRQPDGGALP